MLGRGKWAGAAPPPARKTTSHVIKVNEKTSWSLRRSQSFLLVRDVALKNVPCCARRCAVIAHTSLPTNSVSTLLPYHTSCCCIAAALLLLMLLLLCGKKTSTTRAKAVSKLSLYMRSLIQPGGVFFSLPGLSARRMMLNVVPVVPRIACVAL